MNPSLDEVSPVDRLARILPELERAARQAQRHAAMAKTPILWPVLFVPGIGGSRLGLLEARTWAQTGSHDTGLWDPDDEPLHQQLYGWLGGSAAPEAQAWSLDLAARWQAPAQVLREHEPAQVLRLMAQQQGLGEGAAPVVLPALQQQLRQRYACLREQGWTALPARYWPLATQLSDRLGTLADPQFAFIAHAHAWDWRAHPRQAAAGLVRRIQALLSQAHLHQLASCGTDGQARSWRWPDTPGLVIVAENAGVDLLRAALPLCPPASVLAVYAVDEVRPAGTTTNGLAQDGSPAWFAALCDTDTPAAPLPGAPLLSHGWRLWQETLQAQRGPRLALNAMLPGPLSLLPQGPVATWLDGAEFAQAGHGWDLLRCGGAWQPLQGQFCADEGRPGVNPPQEATWQAQAQAAAELTLAQSQASTQDFAALAEPPPWISCQAGAAAPPVARLSLQHGIATDASALTQGEGVQTWRLQLQTQPQEGLPQGSRLVVGSSQQLCAGIQHHLSQQLLRQPPTPFGQELRPAVAARLSTLARTASS
ncbi:hypothetical protein [Roseateles koreensis]|uniref:Uncharacterized protein n=1 Tax=Roseateles koreensis TaxID=2987526 RepID=A0ABT5KQW3_9BURK|nr:hypothetical protein [Roseateles koreensis]MDC8785304.1 hypothetical protein [Roseateles koreensis]